MRKLLLPLAAFFLLVYCNNRPTESQDQNALATPAKTPLDLKMKINGYPNGKLKLLGFYGDQNWAIDSAITDANGNAHIKRDTPLYEGMYFIAFPDQKFAQVLIGPEQQITLEFTKSDPVSSMKVQGSPDTELLYKNLRFEADMQKQFDAVRERMEKAAKGTPEYVQAEKDQEHLVKVRKEHIKWFKDNYPTAFFTKFKIAGQNPELKKEIPDEQLQVYYYRKEFWDGVDFSDVRLLRTPVYFNKLKRYMKELTPQVPDSLMKYADLVTEKSKANKEIFKYTANWIAINYKDTKVMGLEAVYVHMVDKYWTHELAWWSDSTEVNGLRGEVALMKPSLIGQTGQDIKAKNESGQYVSLYDLKTPYTVLYFYSYECDNCKKETPKLVKVMMELKQKGLADLFTLCLDDKEETWKAYLKQSGLTPAFHNVMDFQRESKYHRKYHIDVTPEIYVLDKNHKIIASNLHAEQIPQVIEAAK